MQNYGDEVLLAIFKQSFGLDRSGCCAEQFMDANPALTEAAYKMLRFVEYVEPDHGSAFGFRPTRQLTHQLLLDPTLSEREKQHPDEEDRRLLNQLIQASGAPALWEGGTGLSNLLVVLRLANWSESHALIPTEWLHLEVINSGNSTWEEEAL